ncbi:MFS transporter [Streptomyces sp. SS52]|nr:MFS transporter [Streptomyces sp. SS52]
MSTAPGAPTMSRDALPWVERIGIPRPLMWGYVAVLIFMIGDGVESNYLEPYLRDTGFSSSGAGLVISVYGAFVALGSWLSGALSNVWGPRRVMRIGAVLWMLFEVLFLVVALPSENQLLVYVFYGLRGIAYPLFAYAFLLWIQLTARRELRGSAAGWFWFAYSAGLRPSAPPSPPSASPGRRLRHLLALPGAGRGGRGDRLLRRQGGPRHPADGRHHGPGSPSGRTAARCQCAQAPPAHRDRRGGPDDQHHAVLRVSSSCRRSSPTTSASASPSISPWSHSWASSASSPTRSSGGSATAGWRSTIAWAGGVGCALGVARSSTGCPTRPRQLRGRLLATVVYGIMLAGTSRCPRCCRLWCPRRTRATPWASTASPPGSPPSSAP